MSPSRVLFVSHSADLLGAERSLLAMLGALDRAICEPIVLLPRRGPLTDALTKLDVRIYYQRLPWWLGRRNYPPVFAGRIMMAAVTFPRLVRLIRSLDPDVVYTNSLVIPSAAFAARWLKIPHIWHLRELPQKNSTLRTLLPLRLIYGLVHRLSSAVVCNSEAVCRFAKELGVLGEVIPNPIVVDPRISAAYLPGNTPRIVVVGTVGVEKGQHLAVAALAGLQSFPDATLHIVGDGPARYIRDLRQQIDGLGLAGRVFFHGFQSQPEGYYLASDLVLVPSREEAFGRTAVEALLLDCLVVGADAGGLTEILPSEFRFEAGCPESAAIVMNSALMRKRTLRDRDKSLLLKHSPAFVSKEVQRLIRQVAQ